MVKGFLMPNWIAVDEETRSSLHSRLPEQTAIVLREGSALEHVLGRNGTTVAVLPCQGLGQAALAVFRWNRYQTSALTPAPQANTRAGGFLGLTDEAIFDEDSEEKKSWWKRFWD